MIRVNGREYPWREGLTIADLLEEMGDPYPYAVVRVNERRVSRPHFQTTFIPDGAEIYLIPLVAGG